MQMNRLRDTLPPAWSAKVRGAIGLRQTTYWDVMTADESSATRVHFVDKLEFHFVAPAFEGVELTNTHPILADYVQPHDRIFVSRPPADAGLAADAIATCVDSWSGGWRSFDRYANTPAMVTEILQSGHGSLLTGPRELVRGVSDVLRAQGAQFTVLPKGRERDWTPIVLRLGENFVVARHVDFERLE